MAIAVPIRDVLARQHLKVPYLIDTGRPGLLMVHTGVIQFLRQVGDPGEHDQVVSFVPYANGDIQTFTEAGAVVPVVTASITSFSDSRGILAVDSAVVSLERLRGVANEPFVLVLRAEIYIMDGGMGRIAYQVTWQEQQRQQMGEVVTLPPDAAPESDS